MGAQDKAVEVGTNMQLGLGGVLVGVGWVSSRVSSGIRTRAGMG